MRTTVGKEVADHPKDDANHCYSCRQRDKHSKEAEQTFWKGQGRCGELHVTSPGSA